ncbi:MAG: hypothetical protein JSS51_03585 [Planctomycetes bacterium]|nr:hypothetical protein [Planctomycetota bacterium]
MPITAQPQRDPSTGFPWGRIWDAQSGDTFVKSFLVETDDLETALLATGLPAKMEAFSASFPNHRCTSLVTEPNGAKSSKVVARYTLIGGASWSGAGSPPPAPEPPKPDYTCSEYRSVNESITIFAAVNVDTGEPMYMPFPINGGAGMPVWVGRTEIDVYVYYPPGKTPDIALFAEYNTNKRQNSEDNLALPPTRNDNTVFTVRRQQLLYMGWKRLTTPSGQTCIVHTLWYAPKHTYFWVDTKADGAVGSPGTSGNINPADVHEVQRYRQAPFAVLWTLP